MPPLTMPTVARICDLTLLIENGLIVYLRYSPEPASDATHSSTDHESGRAVLDRLRDSGLNAAVLRARGPLAVAETTEELVVVRGDQPT